ncbi:MAG: ABC transporter permease [Ruminococcus sp.]|nr:ABC transporter permease [Ruminococcus sp.]
MKFINLLKKELSELINKQMILGLAVTMIILMFVGNMMESTIGEAVSESYSINICDRDDTELTHTLLNELEASGASVKLCQAEGDDYSAILEENDIPSLVIIPEGFSDTLLTGGTSGQLISISAMDSAATMSNISNDNSGALALIEDRLTNILAIEAGISENQLALMDNPLVISEQTVVADNSAAISIDDVMNDVMMQNMILPIVVFVLIMMTSQMLISTISNEKIDKTLETLLSAPVSRTAVIAAKMLAAAAVALINAAVYMFGFSFFVSGATDSVTEEMNATAAGQFISVDAALEQLGLTLGAVDYIFIGLQLFLTIMICLSVSLILGAMANDIKSSQNMTMPILMLAMVPYLISMLADINSLPMIFRVIVYAIPFTHTFSAMSNLMFGNTAVFFGGLAYQAVVFLLCMFFALKLFKSDKIFTISLNFGQKARFKRNTK